MKIYNVSSLSQFYEAVDDLHCKMKQSSEVSAENSPGKGGLWFRAHGYAHYQLLPTLYRGKYYKSNKTNTYSQMNLKEDLRYQHFKARVYHSIHSNPVRESEWMEIYQHHFGSTRLMDWTESARTALLFTLEARIDTRTDKKLEYERWHQTPCVWVLNPYLLNFRAYDFLAGRMGNQKQFMGTLSKSTNFRDLCREMKNNKEIYFNVPDEDIEIQGILSLCVLEDYRASLGAELEQYVKNLQFNPFYYTALRVYSDGLPYIISDEKEHILPPLAILHPYHSERIRSQRGVFTIFPNYILGASAQEYISKRKIDIRAMENQPYINDCLACINILNPSKVAETLIKSGGRRTELYPDIQNYADVIETKDYYY